MKWVFSKNIFIKKVRFELSGGKVFLEYKDLKVIL